MKKWFFYILIACIIGCGESDGGCDKTPIDTLVLSFGQSNSRGITGNKRLFNERSNVFFFSSLGWRTTHDYKRIGPEAFLGERLGAKYPNKNIGVVKIAHGGTRIDEWLPDARLYDKVVHAIESAKQCGGVENISGFFWIQGGADAKEYMDSINYAYKLDILIASLRNDEAPFIIGLTRIGIDGYEYAANVLEAQIHVAANTAESYAIETSDLETHEGIHFTESALKILGERFANKFIEVQP